MPNLRTIRARRRCGAKLAEAGDVLLREQAPATPLKAEEFPVPQARVAPL